VKTWLCTFCCELSVIFIIQVCSRLDILTQLWYICFKLDYLRKFALCDSQQVESLMFVVLVFLSCPFFFFSHAILVFKKLIQVFGFTLFTLIPLIWLGTTLKLASFGLETFNIRYLTIVCGVSLCNNHGCVAEVLKCSVIFFQVLLSPSVCHVISPKLQVCSRFNLTFFL